MEKFKDIKKKKVKTTLKEIGIDASKIKQSKFKDMKSPSILK